jgi:hypothetical protein
MPFCQECLNSFLETPERPELIIRGTAAGRHFILWVRLYSSLRQSAGCCIFCRDIFSCQFDPANQARLKELLELSETDRDKLHVEAELFWTGTLYDSLNIRFFELKAFEDGEAQYDQLSGSLHYDIYPSDGKR